MGFGVTAYAGTKKTELWINPVDGIITSSFGTRINPVLNISEFHDGIDIAVPAGTEVIAVKSGTVTEIKKSSTYGNVLTYKTNDGYTVMYAHLQSIDVRENQKIVQGQVVAKSGNTGLTTGAHLHYGLWDGDILIDPMSRVVLPHTADVAEEYASRKEPVPF